MALSELNTSQAANQGRPVALLHPATQTPIGIRFYILGADSKECRRIQRDQQAARLEKQKKTRTGVYLPTPEEVEENGLELLVGLTTGWDEDVVGDDGKTTGTRKEIELSPGKFVPFSPEAVRDIYKDLGLSWIREQIDSAIGDRRDFLPSAKNRSLST